MTLEEAKVHLRVDGNEDDALITSLIKSARSLAEQYTRRAFITQTWEQYQDVMPGRVELRRPPLQSLIGVYCTDQIGMETEVDQSTYTVFLGEDTPVLMLNFGHTWPLARKYNGYRIHFIAGYGDTPDKMPEPIKTGILTLLAAGYENREALRTLDEVSTAYLKPYKVWLL